MVEDDAAIRQLIIEALLADGYQAFGAGDAPSALNAVRSQRPDLIITDYHLPGSDGLELLRSLQEGGFADVPALVVSADNRPPDWPVTSFIPKPFDLEVILRAVRRALGLPGPENAGGSCAFELSDALATLFGPPELGLA